MKVYRGSVEEFNSSSLFPFRVIDGVYYASDEVTRSILQPKLGCIVHTGANFTQLSGPGDIRANSYYRLDGVYTGSTYARWTSITAEQAQANAVVSVFDIMECDYSGQDMGQRSVTATIKYPTPIDFRLGDYIEVPMQSLLRNGKRGTVEYEKFYIYTEPQCKKTARPMSTGDAFETIVKFYPRQHELGTVQMRDFIQTNNQSAIVYTGFDEVTFYGGAYELLERCMACLSQQFIDNDGNPLWSYELADSVNENINNALERFELSFSGQSVMDALTRLSDTEGINTTFFINGRKIYVGFKRPYLCKVNANGAIDDSPLKLMYGKTSHKAIDLDHGGLYDITKSVNDEMPITKLFAYGASRNLNRYYCSDRIQSGRFVNKLMLPSFSDDGRTDYIISEDGVRKYGIVEGSHTFDDIYPSIRYMTYADIRGIKYCIKIKTSGLENDKWVDGKMEHTNSSSSYPVARVQCYKVVACGENGESGDVGVNKLVECAPPNDLAVYIHATGKTVKVVLCGGATNAEAIGKQIQHDGKVPTTDGVTPSVGGDYSKVHPGSCFCVHDIGWPDMDGTEHTAQERAAWFNAEFRRISDTDSLYAETEEQQQAELHRIEYVDTFWMTDLYVFNSYIQENFVRDGYSAWAWPRLNKSSNFPDSLLVNEVVAVEPVVIADTSDNIDAGRQQHWDIYLRDIGFAIDEQNDFGEMVFVFNTPVVSVLDGILSGREFTIDGGNNLNDFQDRVVCAYREDGTFNYEFLQPGDSNRDGIGQEAFARGAIWKIRLNRNDSDDFLNSVGVVIPNTDIYMSAGDHVVLLDIYMPDIYVRAAEQRLLREAQKFLDKNDKNNVNYSISFDKVRIQQIPNYALQMREGVLMRMVDDDLNITSENKIRELVSYGTPAAYNVPLFEQDSEISTDLESALYKYYKDVVDGEPKLSSIILDYTYTTAYDGRMKITLPKSYFTATFDSLLVSHDYGPVKTLLSNVTAVSSDDRWLLTFDCPLQLRNNLLASKSVEFMLKENVTRAHYTKDYVASGEYVGAICQDYVDFKSNKYYEVSLIVDGNFWDTNHEDIILTPSQADVASRFIPDDYELQEPESLGDNKYRLKYSFYLPDSFDDATGYYVAVWYHGNGSTDYARIWMESVVEKDIDEDGNVVNYVDFLASSVNVKITDNTRPDETRIIGSYPEPIREISAQIAEQTNASPWTQLRNDVKNSSIEIEQAHKTYESLAQVARINYNRLLTLKSNIFDPDGTCNDVFIQTMMLQVGADSMNYQLDKTFTTPTGVKSNFSVDTPTGQTHQFFKVNEDDLLHHFVYTQGAQGGTWAIPGGFSFELAPNEDDTWPVYYICIRCKKDDDNDMSVPAWICSKKQYAVNDSEGSGNYWYFNWGILVPDSNGLYSFTETRGNAYMYGDNIIAGKISTIAGNSYFDLTHGNFVLTEGTEESAALSYIDGILTIKGINDDSVDSILSRLNLLDEIGGENMVFIDGGNYNDESDYFDNTGEGTNRISLTEYYINQEGGNAVYTMFDPGTFVFSASILNCNIVRRNGVPVSGALSEFSLNAIDENNTVHTSVALSNGENVHDVKIITTVPCHFVIIIRYTYDRNQKKIFVMSGMQLQRGTKSTEYHEYVNHLTNALKGSTEISGGLTMTNILMLKNENGEVKAGMSGLTNDGENVLMWGGATYAEALYASINNYLKEAGGGLIPTLLKKDGTGKMGCFRVINENTVSVMSSDGTSEIVISAGENAEDTNITILQNGVAKVIISGDTINRNTVSGVTVQGKYESYSYITATTQTFVMTQIDLSGGSGSWTVNFDADKMMVMLEIMPLMSIVQVRGYIDVYMCGKRIASSGFWTSETVSSGSSVSQAVGGTMSISKFYSAGSAMQNVELRLRNIEVRRGSDWSTNFNNGIRVAYVRFCKKTGSGSSVSDYTDASVYFSNVSSEDIVQIGRNGIQVSHKNGGFVQMLNDGSELYVRMFGLPGTAPSGSDTSGRIYSSGGYLRIVESN